MVARKNEVVKLQSARELLNQCDGSNRHGTFLEAALSVSHSNHHNCCCYNSFVCTHVVAAPHGFACVVIPITELYSPSFVEIRSEVLEPQGSNFALSHYYGTSRDYNRALRHASRAAAAGFFLLAPPPPKYVTGSPNAAAAAAENFRPRRRESSAADRFDRRLFMLFSHFRVVKILELT